MAFPVTSPVVPRVASRPPPRRRPWTGSEGFSIMEVAMATFVMAFGIATSIIALQSGFKTLDVARGTTLASQILQSEMESIRLMSWSQVHALDGTTNVDLSTVFTTDPTVASRFTLQRTIGDLSGKEGEMKEITLVVSWRTVDGRPLNRSFRTYYTRNGLYDYFYTLARS